MENASKALIIAGAILISIILISVGLYVMSQTSKVTDQVGGQMDSMAVQQFNSKFDAYVGANKTASEIKSLISTISSSNSVDTAHLIKVTTTGMSTNISAKTAGKDLATVTSNLSNTRRYTVTVTNVVNGYYESIKIVQN